MAEHCIVAPGGSSSSKWWFSAANGSWKLSFEYVCVAVIYYHSCKNWLRSCIRRAWSSTAIGVADWREMSPIHKNNDMPSWTRSYEELFYRSHLVYTPFEDDLRAASRLILTLFWSVFWASSGHLRVHFETLSVQIPLRFPEIIGSQNYIPLSLRCPF